MRFSKFTVVCHLCQLKTKRTTNTCCPSAELGFSAAVMEHQDQKQLGEITSFAASVPGYPGVWHLEQESWNGCVYMGPKLFLLLQRPDFEWMTKVLRNLYFY